MDGIDQRVEMLSDAMHRALTAHGDHCWLMLDPSVAHTAGRTALEELLRERTTVVNISSPHRQLDDEAMPMLVSLDSARPEGSRLLKASLEQSLNELAPQVLRTQAGRYVCGWWCAPAEAGAALALHLRRVLVMRLGSEGSTFVRWHDPAVLWAVWPLLDAPQQVQLLGPSKALWNLSPTGAWRTYEAPPFEQTQEQPVEAAVHPLGLATQQRADLELITPLNAAMRNCAEVWQARMSEEQARETAMAALRRAPAMGFDDKRDLALFAQKALTVHPQFDLHPLVARRLGSRQNGDYFSALIDDLSESEWALVAGQTIDRSVAIHIDHFKSSSL